LGRSKREQKVSRCDLNVMLVLPEWDRRRS